MQKKIVAVLMSLTLVFSVIPIELTAKSTFPDVTQYQEYITYLADKEIIKGKEDGTFGPTEDVKRIQAIQMILNDLGVELGDAPKPSFSDVDPDTYGYDYIAKAAELGLIKSREGNKFSAFSPMTRGEIAYAIDKAYNLSGGSSNGFTDVSNAYYAKEAIYDLKANNITRGYPDNTFKPNQSLSRQHFSVFLAKTINTAFREGTDENKVTATISRIVDGDTIEIRLNGKEETVQLLLVDTPETDHPIIPVQKYGPEAATFAKETLPVGKEIQLEYDGDNDKYDALLSYIWVDGKMFNQLLLEKGLARYAYENDPPYTYQAELKAAEAKAKAAGIGVWSVPGYVTSDGFKVTEDEQTEEENSTSDGNDRMCSDFDSQEEAQNFFEEEGGPEDDPHGLDKDNDGLVCEELPTTSNTTDVIDIY